ncbi:unnamed protein product [Closterium sp. NIES-64]|nr:unnamed protein product [Closterium sp. NIES-64]CAI5988788.1 unnamed protein product [Closterium sp. NIES-65]CAI5991919.1 unnamed protein product [Closterium sp. NIES-65]
MREHKRRSLSTDLQSEAKPGRSLSSNAMHKSAVLLCQLSAPSFPAFHVVCDTPRGPCPRSRSLFSDTSDVALSSAIRSSDSAIAACAGDSPWDRASQGSSACLSRNNSSASRTCDEPEIISPKLRLPTSREFSRLRLCSSEAGPSSPLFSRKVASPLRKRDENPRLKRKRPPMLNIPAKDSFTASPTTTPGNTPGNTPRSTRAQEAEEASELVAVGHSYAVMCKKGRREFMEDAYQAITQFGTSPGNAFFGVFDGHGGTMAARFAAGNIAGNVLKAAQQGAESPEAALVEGFKETDKQFLLQNLGSGSAVVTCWAAPGSIHVAHAGDCRAVLCRKGAASVLTSDHKASREDERDRVENLGGHVDNFTGTWRVQGVLAVTRGLGDASYKEYITPEPEVVHVPVTRDCDFLIMASDGLWDVVTNQEAVDIARSCLEAEIKAFKRNNPPSANSSLATIPSFSSTSTESSSLTLNSDGKESASYDGLTTPSPDADSNAKLNPFALKTPRERTSSVFAVGSLKQVTESAQEGGNHVPDITACPSAEDSDVSSSSEDCGNDVSDGSEEGEGSEGSESEEGGEAEAASRAKAQGTEESVKSALLLACQKLVEAAGKRGSHDDTSVMVISLAHYML